VVWDEELIEPSMSNTPLPIAALREFKPDPRFRAFKSYMNPVPFIGYSLFLDDFLRRRLKVWVFVLSDDDDLPP